MEQIITFEHLTIEPYKVEKILDIQIQHKINEHSTLYIRALLSDDVKDNYIKECIQGSKVGLKLINSEKNDVLFYGMVKDIELEVVQGSYYRVNHFSYGLAPNVLGYRHPAAILDRSKNKCCGLITDGEELKNNQLCFSVDTTVLHLFSDLSRTCPRTSGGWIPPLALTPKNNRSVSFLVA